MHAQANGLPLSRERRVRCSLYLDHPAARRLHRGAGFAQALTRLGLVDEYWLLVHPVALGAGLSMFKDLPKSIDLKLVRVKAFPGGTVAKTYRPA